MQCAHAIVAITTPGSLSFSLFTYIEFHSCCTSVQCKYTMSPYFLVVTLWISSFFYFTAIECNKSSLKKFFKIKSTGASVFEGFFFFLNALVLQIAPQHLRWNIFVTFFTLLMSVIWSCFGFITWLSFNKIYCK